MTFRVGQPVICVDDNEDSFVSKRVRYTSDSTLEGLVKGEIYHIRAVGFCPLHEIAVVWVREIIRRPDYIYPDEAPFAAARFRPVQEQGMSILRSIAANPKQKIRELA